MRKFGRKKQRSERNIADDGSEKIVEIVRDTAREQSKLFQGLGFASLRFAALPFGDVAKNEDDARDFVFVVTNRRGSLLNDTRVPLISATGSCRMGHVVAQAVASRMGRALLELGGNNGIIVMGDANPDLVLRAVLFGAVGTAGQRCTTTRRLFLQRCFRVGRCSHGDDVLELAHVSRAFGLSQPYIRSMTRVTSRTMAVV